MGINLDDFTNDLVEVICFTDEPQDIIDYEVDDSFYDKVAMAVLPFLSSLYEFEETWEDHPEYPTPRRLAHFLWYVGQGHGVHPSDDIEDEALVGDIVDLADALGTVYWEVWTTATMHIDAG